MAHIQNLDAEHFWEGRQPILLLTLVRHVLTGLTHPAHCVVQGSCVFDEIWYSQASLGLISKLPHNDDVITHSGWHQLRVSTLWSLPTPSPYSTGLSSRETGWPLSWHLSPSRRLYFTRSFPDESKNSLQATNFSYIKQCSNQSGLTECNSGVRLPIPT
jgi:hypothetical protein